MTFLKLVSFFNFILIRISFLGFNIGIFNYRDIQFAVWDVSCQDNIRSLWPHYSKNTKGLIFVIDSSDYRRIYEARAELKRMLSKTELKDVVLLIYANKDVSFEPIFNLIFILGST
jgi:ADP-ribosylation factor protein 1